MTSRTILQEAFDFTLDDLEANRNGRRSKRQMGAELLTSRRYLIETAGLALLLGAAVVYIWTDKGFWMAVDLGVMVILIVASFWYAQYKIYRWGVAEIRLMDKGVLKHLASFKRADVETWEEGESILKAVPVDETKLYMTDEAYAVLEDSVTYRVYYWCWFDKENTPCAEILSLEPLD